MLGYLTSNLNEIKSFDILHKTNLNIFVIENYCILYENNIINNACLYGHVQVLEWFKKSGYKFEYDEKAINNACLNGHVKVLQWFKKSGFKLKYTNDVIKHATQKTFKFLIKNIYVKKVIKYYKYIKNIKFKTHNKYLKGYNKN